MGMILGPLKVLLKINFHRPDYETSTGNGSCSYFFKSDGLRITWLAGILSSWQRSSSFLSISSRASSNGVQPFKLALATLLMWLVIRVTCSWSKPANVVPLGII